MLEIKDLYVRYGMIEAIKGISFEVRDGEIVTLIGSNGAGKTTTMHAISGLLKPASGSIMLDGVELTKTPNHKIVSMGLAQVPEGRRVFADLTVEENLDMGAFMLKDDALIKRKKEEMFDFFPILGQRKKQKSRSLSGGEQQMLAVARALMSSPRLLLLDEPGLGLAPLIVQEIFSKIKLINKEDKVTVFVVEQNARLALKSSDDGYVMENGVIVLHDEAQALLKNQKVRAAYLGE